MQEVPYFSIIIPCLNEEKSLPHLLKDLQEQSYKDFDVFVVDGHSDDKTPLIVKRFAKKNPRLHLVPCDVRNVGHQRNLGATKSKGKYVVFFDADNRIPTFYLAGLHYQCVKENTPVFTTFATADTQNAKDKLFMSFTNTVFDSGAKIGLPFTFGACIGVLRSIFFEIKGFDETIKFGEDTEFVRRVVKHGYDFTVFHEPMYAYSLRRFRKEGTLTLTRRLAPVGLKMIMNKKTTKELDIYPMLGGSYFDTQEKEKGSTQTFQQVTGIIKTLREILSS